MYRSLWQKILNLCNRTCGQYLAISHRIIEKFVLEGTCKVHIVQPLCNEQIPAQSDLEYFQGWGNYHPSGQPVPLPHHCGFMGCEYRTRAFCQALAQQPQLLFLLEKPNSDVWCFQRLSCTDCSRDKSPFHHLYIQKEHWGQKQQWKVTSIEFFSGMVALVSHSPVQDFSTE